MRYRSRLAGVLVSLVLIAGVSAAGVGGAGAQAAQRAAVTGWPALGHFQLPAADRPQPAPEHRVPTLGPHISGTTNTSESTNWAGYVDTGTTFSGVGGEWTVPAVQPSGVHTAAASQWIGIDGATNQSLIQTGTSEVNLNGATQYFAWYEILPAAAVVIGSVSPGDDMQATILQNPDATWTITILDNTSQSISQNTLPYSGPASSAEWIVEDPTITSGTPPVTSQPPLANFGTAPFSNLGVLGTDVNSTGVTPIDMVDASSNVIAYPGTLSASGFIVTYVPLSITTGSLTVDINTSSSQTLTATGGAIPYVWSITSGTLPTGLTLNASSGAITGVPTVAGNQNVTFKVTDALDQVATATVSIAIVSPGPYSPLPPARICDTRAGNPSSLSGPAAQCLGRTIQTGGTLTINLANVAGSFVPAGATAVVLNVTVVNPIAGGYVTAYPTGAVVPFASNIDYVRGQVVPNLVEVGVGSGGQVSFFASTQTDLVVDVEGYTSASAAGGAGAGLYNALPSPVRMCDTRAGNPSGLSSPNDQCNGKTLATNGILPVKVANINGIPAGATAAVFNVTVVNPQGAGFLTVFPQGSTQPFVSNLDYTAGQVTANRVIVPLSTGGATPGYISVYSSSRADVVVDVSGYYTAATGNGSQFSAEGAPVRICDTRGGNPSNLSGSAAQCNSTPLVGTRTVQVSGLAGVPSGATAVVINLTGVLPTAPTFLTVFPNSPPSPLVSDLDQVPGDVGANLVVATLSPSGTIEILNDTGSIDVVVDVLGWYS
jgi:hypothetical protein